MKVKFVVGLFVVLLTTSLLWLLPVTKTSADVVTAAQVSEYSLENGMKVLVKPDNRSNVVASQVWYKVGSSYEYGGITGVSHMLEHMMFKGTQSLQPGEFSEVIAKNGGEYNAFTGADYTAYIQVISADKLEIGLKLEADRMRNLVLLQKEFVKELEVVKEERRLRTDDQPTELTYERFMATAFTNSPYQNPVIGWMEDLNTLQLEDLASWYQKWYAPNNATLVVVGNVKPEEVFRLARQYFGQHRAAEVAVVKPQIETRQRGMRRIEVNAPAQLPTLLMGFKVPSLLTALAAQQAEKSYALEVLAGILDGGDSARLPAQLIRGQQIAASASVFYNTTGRLDTLFEFSATPTKGKSIAELEQALWKQIESLKTAPVSAAELARVKAQVIASDVYERDSMHYEAVKLGLYETIGLGWQRLDDYVRQIDAVTAKQVQQVAKEYLLREHMTVAELVPQVLNGGSQQ